MECKWAGCSANDIHGMREHLELHIKECVALVCMWDDCPRKQEPFSNKYALQAHMRIHTGDKPYKCEKCEKCFSRADALGKHVKKHESSAIQQAHALGKFFYNCQLRDELENETEILLEEREFQLSCLRLLNEELLFMESDPKGQFVDSWDNYL